MLLGITIDTGVLITGAISIIIGLVVGDIYARVKHSGKKSWERYKTERTQEMQEALKPIIKENIEAAIKPVKDEVAAVQVEVQAVREEVNNINEEVLAIRNEDISRLNKANRDSIRCQLYEIYDRCIEYKTTNDVENESELWDSYKALSGNHGCDARHEVFVALPLEDHYFYAQRQAAKKETKKETK